MDHQPPGLIGTIRGADVVGVVADAAGSPLEEVEMVLAVLGQRGLTLTPAPRNQLGASDPDPGLHPGLIIANKVDLAAPGTIEGLQELYAGCLEVQAVSTVTRQGFDELFRRLGDLLAVIRVYSKEPGRQPDLNHPFAVPIGATVEDLARLIHRELPS